MSYALGQGGAFTLLPTVRGALDPLVEAERLELRRPLPTGALMIALALIALLIFSARPSRRRR